MFTDDFTHQIGSVLQKQSSGLFAQQREVAASTFRQRSGRLTASLQGTPSIVGTAVHLEYPKYIRFLDMKKSRLGRRKVSGRIYNRPVYGFMVSGVRRWLIAAGQQTVIRMINETFTDIRK